MDIGTAIDALKRGARVTRRGWNGKGMWLELQRPDKHSKMTLPYVYMRTAQGDLVPWLASQADLLADDWAFCAEPEQFQFDIVPYYTPLPPMQEQKRPDIYQ